MTKLDREAYLHGFGFVARRAVAMKDLGDPKLIIRLGVTAVPAESVFDPRTPFGAGMADAAIVACGLDA